ncbi:hypothetical protein J5N97_009082 [Dioscorea zingiberensis]|uniref:Saposin B-type domain-containing protein n=1 Tax=Dioscorea zingiberensis TaxID=325984 RepID=A0A9D5CXJ1_9LILI|nr:hypothetical protein J5N97_009082 [Dioscorea zingiberensis]
MDMKMVWSLGIILTLVLHVDARFECMSLKKDVTCNSCLEASRKADKALNNKNMFKEVNLLSNQVCQSLPFDLKIECLKKSRDQIHRTRIQLQEYFHEKSLCNSTGLCHHQSKVPENNEILGKSLSYMKEKPCTGCRRAVRDIVWRLKDPRMKSKLTSALLDYCEEADEHEDQCKQAVYRYGSIILNKLERLKPYDLCLMMGFCDEEISV